MSKTCPKCGLKNNDSSKECKGCFFSLSDVISKPNNQSGFKIKKAIPVMCPSCGAKMKNNNPVCPSCFKDVNDKTKYVEQVKRTSQSNSKKSVMPIVILAIIVVVGSLYGYGYWKASDQLKRGTLNIIIAGVTVESLNPISAQGYKSYLKNRTDIMERIESLQKLGF